MNTDTQSFITSIRNCSNTAELVKLNNEFSDYYKSLDISSKLELEPYFQQIRNSMEFTVSELDLLSTKAEFILSKYE